MPPTVWLGLSLLAMAMAMFSALTHNALRSFSRARLEEALVARGRRKALARLYRHHDDLLRLTRTMHILSLVSATALACLWSTGEFGFTATGWLAGAAVAAGLGVVFGGVIPLTWAKCAAESVLVRTLPTAHALRVPAAPLHAALVLFDRLVRRLLGAPRPGETTATSIEEEIASVVNEGEREGAIEENQGDMIENVIKFRRADAGQIMTPRTDVVSIDADAPLPDARRLIAQSGFSRIPATRGSLDAIVGILYAKDLLGRSGHEDEDGVRVRDVMRPPVFVPETKRLGELMHEFRRRQVHAAVVLDEYGGTSGLVTMEDVVEEIVGEIADEYDPAAPPGIRPVADGGWDVDARVHVDELNDEIGVEIPEHEDYETIGGFVLSRLGAIPKPGETLEAEGLRIRVLDADPRRILRLRLERTAAAREPTTED